MTASILVVIEPDAIGFDSGLLFEHLARVLDGAKPLSGARRVAVLPGMGETWRRNRLPPTAVAG
jgi:hypothetical protein